MPKYSSNTDMTISYSQEHLRVFHETKDVFLRYRAGKETKRLAAEAHKSLLEEQTLRAAEQVHTTSERARLRQENACEHRELIGDILIEFCFFLFFYIQLTPHSSTGMAGSSPRLTNPCALTTTAASRKVRNKPSPRRHHKPHDSANQTSEIHRKKRHLNRPANQANLYRTLT